MASAGQACHVDGGRGARLLRYGTIAEIVITGVVLAVVAVLGTLPPS